MKEGGEGCGKCGSDIDIIVVVTKDVDNAYKNVLGDFGAWSNWCGAEYAE
jgi:hypothetical protein